MLPSFLHQGVAHFQTHPSPTMLLTVQSQVEIDVTGRYQLPVLLFVGVIAVLIVCGAILPVFFQPKTKRKKRNDSKKS